VTDLETKRKQKDEFFAVDPHSPLTPEQQARFGGLDYFPENRELVIEAELDTDVDSDEVRMQYTAGDEPTYRRAGRIRFEVEGRPAELTLFASEKQHELFLPFRDATSGDETYAAGRYLEVEPPRGGRVVVDFNQAYNPYCAYNERWSCPLPPRENWLEVPIRAGEKLFAGSIVHG
jgi:uncharacterized protein (DUF1684 family)